MKISIDNFKSIGGIADYEIKPFTILSGVNSSGKSSFIQLLLLLKQTIEYDSAASQLYLAGNLFPVRNYLDIINGKSLSHKLKIAFQFEKSELNAYKDGTEIDLFESFENYTCVIECLFDFENNKEFVREFSVRFNLLNDIEEQEQHIKFINNVSDFKIETNTGAFGDKLFYEQGKYQIASINYLSFFPSEFDMIINGNRSTEVPKIKGIKAAIEGFFKQLSYIGPLREQPKDEYKATGSNNKVGTSGEFVAEVLEKHAGDGIKLLKLIEDDGTLSFAETDNKLIEAVKYWICEKFNLCDDIFSIKNVDSYSIHIKSHTGIESTIRHVGFGLSQVLPIIVEGLLLKPGETLILEQPEIHLHPKIQSLLFDFLISMVLQGKSVIIETHSDHLINRLRRRIAEDETYNIKDKICLTFIEPSSHDLLFRNIDIDDLGTLDYFPEDFIEKPDVELKAILKAQMKKRLNKKE